MSAAESAITSAVSKDIGMMTAARIAVAILVGIKLLFSGMTMITVGSAAKRLARGVEEARA